MRTTTLAAAVAALLLVASGAALLAGVVPLPGDADVGETPRPTATVGGGATATPGGATATPGSADVQFRLDIRNVEECGTTCRDVTSTLTNVGTASASNVVVRTRLYAGNSTDESDRIWEGSEDVGTLDAGGSHTTTKRVTLSTSEAFAVQQADGWVTIRTTIRSDQRTVTITERRDVT